MMRETPINRSVSPIISLVFPSLFPHPLAQPLQDGTPCYVSHVMLYLTDLDFNSEEGHYVLSNPVKSTERHTPDTSAPSWNTRYLS